MSEGPAREMSLAEWVDTLHKDHRARLELEALEAENKDFRGENMVWCNRERAGALHQAEKDSKRYRDALEGALREMWAESYSTAHELIEDALIGRNQMSGKRCEFCGKDVAMDKLGDTFCCGKAIIEDMDMQEEKPLEMDTMNKRLKKFLDLSEEAMKKQDNLFRAMASYVHHTNSDTRKVALSRCMEMEKLIAEITWIIRGEDETEDSHGKADVKANYPPIDESSCKIFTSKELEVIGGTRSFTVHDDDDVTEGEKCEEGS